MNKSIPILKTNKNDVKTREEQRDMRTTRQTENNEQNGNSKPFPIKNYLNVKKLKLSNQNTQSN